MPARNHHLKYKKLSYSIRKETVCQLCISLNGHSKSFKVIGVKA